jgi:hypothetical protein
MHRVQLAYRCTHTCYRTGPNCSLVCIVCVVISCDPCRNVSCMYDLDVNRIRNHTCQMSLHIYCIKKISVKCCAASQCLRCVSKRVVSFAMHRIFDLALWCLCLCPALCRDQRVPHRTHNATQHTDAPPMPQAFPTKQTNTHKETTPAQAPVSPCLDVQAASTGPHTHSRQCALTHY